MDSRRRPTRRGAVRRTCRGNCLDTYIRTPSLSVVVRYLPSPPFLMITTRMKIRGSVVSSSFIFPHPPEDEKKKDNNSGWLLLRRRRILSGRNCSCWLLVGSLFRRSSRGMNKTEIK